MTLLEYKIQMAMDGYLTHEEIVSINAPNDGINITVRKKDIDELTFYHHIICDFSYYVQEDFLLNRLQDAVHTISTRTFNRRKANINECNHDFQVVGTLKKCVKCLGKFGQVVTIELKAN